MKKEMKIEKAEIKLPIYPTCKLCRYYLSDICGPCLNENGKTMFRMRQDITFEDMPPFPTVYFNDGMPVRMRQAVVGAYMEKIVQKLQEVS
jgi:hypothetical protein